MRIKPKMILVISSVVILSVVPLSVIVLWRNQAVLVEKTYDVCRNLGSGISNLATEELLMDETYEATGTAMLQLRKSEIAGLRDSFVVNLDGRIVADLTEKKVGQPIEKDLHSELMSLENLRMSETDTAGIPELRFAYPIFVTSFEGKKMRVGTALFLFDRSVVFEPVKTLRASILIVCGVLLLLGLIVGLFTAVWFSKPIQVLSEGARIIGGGNLAHRIRIDNRDELGDLAHSFNQMTEQIQDFTNNLEQKVKDRTEELNLALEEVTALKTQQDGDYFLTSLLLEPLRRNANASAFAPTTYTIKQKKTFRFKHWESEIGGDICITDSVPIGGRQYTIFINADAMGKSIQGAGGALVLGAVFQAIIVRSRVGRHQSKSPEMWLRDAFLDLQNIFVSFNGSMYISMVIGLVGDDGILYFVNAEHPWPVLYRNGKAAFMNESEALRKLGVPGQEERFRVQICRLEPGDIVIAGSDGRDDLLLGESIDSVNEDENEFLRRVEESHGDLDQIVAGIENFGKVIDDLSLIRLEFRGERQPVESMHPDTQIAINEGLRLEGEGKTEEALKAVEAVLQNKKLPDLLQWAGRLYFRHGDHEKALECFLGVVDLRPADDESVYVTSNLFRMLNRMNDAADFGERLFLRNPYHEFNLLNLAAVYEQTGQYQRSERLIRSCLDLNADVEEAKALLSRLLARADGPEMEHVSPEEMQKMTARADHDYDNREYYRAAFKYRNIVALEPEIEWCLFRLGNCLTKLGQLEEARTFYNRTLLISPHNYHARNNLGVVYHRMGLVDRARTQLDRALKESADFKPAKVNLRRLKTAPANAA